MAAVRRVQLADCVSSLQPIAPSETPRSHQSPKRSFALRSLAKRASRAQFGFHVGIFDHVFPQAIQAQASSIATEPDLIASRRFADEGKLRDVWGRAQPFGQPVERMMISSLPSPRSAQTFSDAINQAGQIAFRFREAEATRRQRRAGHRSRVQNRGLIFGLHGGGVEQRGDSGFVRIACVGKDHVLVRRQTEFNVRKSLRNLTQRGFLRVLHATHVDEQAEKPFPIRGLVPADQVLRGREFVRFVGRQRDPGALVHFFPA